MELTKFLSFLAVVLPMAYGAPTEVAESLHPQILAAMKRDLGLETREANARAAFELRSVDTIEALKQSTGASFAGAWMSADGKTLNVATTDKTLVSTISAAGAKPAVVANSLSKLQSAKSALDKIDIAKPETLSKRAADSGIAAYFVDVAANKFIIEALPSSASHAHSLAKQVGLSSSEYEVHAVNSMPTTFATSIGGDAYYIDNEFRCSIGFSVTTGFVSAGHCGKAGSSATTPGGATYGTFSGSVFPGSADMSYIKTVSGTVLRGVIDGYGGGNIAVKGSTASAVGASVCRSGSTTGVYCGSVQAKDSTVTYSQGRVTGLTRTSVCAEGGDSGGSFFSGGQAQGVTSGGSGDCSSGGTTYFQPVKEILQTYGLTLVTS